MALLGSRRNAVPQAAKIDPVTGLGNAPMFEHEILRAIARYDRNRETFSIIVLASDDGHTGDPSRQTAIARMLADLARTEDAPCHLQARWFGVVLEGAHEQGARAALERMRTATDWQPGEAFRQPPVGGVAEWNSGLNAPSDLVAAAMEDLERYNASLGQETLEWRPGGRGDLRHAR